MRELAGARGDLQDDAEPDGLPRHLWSRLQACSPLLRAPESVYDGRVAVLDELLQGGSAAPASQPVHGLCRTWLLNERCAAGRPLSLSAPHPSLEALLDACPRSAPRPWLAVRISDEAFRDMAERGVRGNLWERLLTRVAGGSVGIGLDSPGEGVCPLYASQGCQGVTLGNLVAGPADCGTLCLDLFACEFVSAGAVLDRSGLLQAVAQAVRLGNALLDGLCWPETQVRRESLQVRRLGLHLADIGQLALRLGLDPRHRGTLPVLRELLSQCARAAAQESLRLGELHGPFPALLQQAWREDAADGGFAAQMQHLLRRFCVRNSQLLMLSPASVLGPAQDETDIRHWSRLLPLLSCADLYSGRLPDTWSMLGPEACHELLWRIWSLGRRHHGVKAW